LAEKLGTFYEVWILEIKRRSSGKILIGGEVVRRYACNFNEQFFTEYRTARCF